jgi:hypothetical protein
MAEDKSLDWYLEKLQALEYLIILLINNPTKYLYLRGKSVKADKIVTIYFKLNNELKLKSSLG